MITMSMATFFIRKKNQLPYRRSWPDGQPNQTKTEQETRKEFSMLVKVGTGYWGMDGI